MILEHSLPCCCEAYGIRNSARRVEGGAGRWWVVVEVERHSLANPPAHRLVAHVPPVAVVGPQTPPNSFPILGRDRDLVEGRPRTRGGAHECSFVLRGGLLLTPRSAGFTSFAAAFAAGGLGVPVLALVEAALNRS